MAFYDPPDLRISADSRNVCTDGFEDWLFPLLGGTKQVRITLALCAENEKHQFSISRATRGVLVKSVIKVGVTLRSYPSTCTLQAGLVLYRGASVPRVWCNVFRFGILP
jgi:hypothetical protein